MRMSCPQCGKAFKVPEEKAGTPVRCSRCREPLVAPSSAAAARDEPARRPPPEPPEQSRGLFRGMSGRDRWAVALLAGAVAASLLLAGAWAVPLAACLALALLAVLHGQATGCPRCGKWWAREEAERGLVEREGFDESGAPVVHSLDRMTYQCAGCGHRWSVTDTRAYRGSYPGRPQRHGG